MSDAPPLDPAGVASATAKQVAAGTQVQATNPSLAANTTFQEDLTTAGQRKVNLIWEYTQAFIAGIVVVANMAVGVYQGFSAMDGQEFQFPPILSYSLFLIVGFYFSRTNHSAIGGVGVKAVSPYVGR